MLLLPFEIGDKVTDDSDVGKLYFHEGNILRVVKAAGAVTSAAGKVLMYSDHSAYTVVLATVADSPDVAGIVPTEVTGDIASGDVFFIKVPVGSLTGVNAAAVSATDADKLVASSTAGTIIVNTAAANPLGRVVGTATAASLTLEIYGYGVIR